MTTPLLSIQDLNITFGAGDRAFHAVRGVSFDVARGECVALVGESGSGKSVTALSVLGLLPYPLARHGTGSSILLDGTQMIGASADTLRRMRGRRAAMVFQEPLTSLNPLHTIYRQIAEVIETHEPQTRSADIRARVTDLLRQVELDALITRLDAYPHELSGGQRQRVMIAMALACRPDLLIADEPTTALDVTVQAEILDLILRLKNEKSMAVLMITHDLSIVRKMADRVCVMKSGEIVEQAPCAQIFASPQHPYTQALLSAHPSGTPDAADPNADIIMSASDIRVDFVRKKNWLGRPLSFVHAVAGVSCTVRAGHTLGIVGESGSGKSTFAMALLRLVPMTGTAVFIGNDIGKMSRHALRPLRAKMPIVFQDPFGSLSPRMSIGDIIGEGLDVHRPDMTRAARDAKIIDALRRVNLDPETRHRYPHEFSGGQRQRVAIARAIVLDPKIILLDEPTSALDVQVQAQIVALLKDLQKTLGIAYIFISHDLRVVRALSHDIIVMKDGRVVEQGPAAGIFAQPQESYTRALMDAALNLKAA